MIYTCPCCNGEFRACNACRQVKPVDEFPIDKKRGKPKAECHLCTNARCRRYKARKAAMRAKSDRCRSRHLPALRESIAARMTGREAAQHVGVSISYLYELARLYDLPPFAKPSPSQNKARAMRFWNDDRLRPIAKLLARKKSRADIGRALGFSKGAIVGAVDRNRPRIEELIAHEARIAMGSR